MLAADHGPLVKVLWAVIDSGSLQQSALAAPGNGFSSNSCQAMQPGLASLRRGFGDDVSGIGSGGVAGRDGNDPRAEAVAVLHFDQDSIMPCRSSMLKPNPRSNAPPPSACWRKSSYRLVRTSAATVIHLRSRASEPFFFLLQ